MMAVFLETRVQITLDTMRALGIFSLLVKQSKFALFWKALYPGGLSQGILGISNALWALSIRTTCQLQLILEAVFH